MKYRAQGTHRMKPQPQANSMTCWRHCFEMLYQWNDYSIYDVRNKLTDAGISPDQGLSDGNYVRAAEVLGLRSDMASTIGTLDALESMLDLWGPMKVGVQWDGVNHAILVFGCDKEYEQFGFFNTWWGSIGEQEDCTKQQWAGFSDLKKGMTARGLAKVVQHW
jgi:hypothetical protein